MDMDRSEERISAAAQLAVLLEVTTEPKPGNVDRGHDHADITMQDFVFGAVNIPIALGNIVSHDMSLGRSIYELVDRGHIDDRNTSFGSFLLVAPHILADLRGTDPESVVYNTDVDDAIWFFRSFDLVDVYVPPRNDLDVYSKSGINEVRERDLSLYDVMKYSQDIDGVAREYIEGFPKSIKTSSRIDEVYEGDLNEALVRVFLELLAGDKDTHISKRHGEDIAQEVMESADELLRKEGDIREFDKELIDNGINPGTSADILCCAIYRNIMRSDGVIELWR